MIAPRSALIPFPLRPLSGTTARGGAVWSAAAAGRAHGAAVLSARRVEGGVAAGGERDVELVEGDEVGPLEVLRVVQVEPRRSASYCSTTDDSADADVSST